MNFTKSTGMMVHETEFCDGFLDPASTGPATEEQIYKLDFIKLKCPLVKVHYEEQDKVEEGRKYLWINLIRDIRLEYVMHSTSLPGT